MKTEKGGAWARLTTLKALPQCLGPSLLRVKRENTLESRGRLPPNRQEPYPCDRPWALHRGLLAFAIFPSASAYHGRCGSLALSVKHSIPVTLEPQIIPGRKIRAVSPRSIASQTKSSAAHLLILYPAVRRETRNLHHGVMA